MTSTNLHRYVVQERHPRTEPRSCYRDNCESAATYDVALDLITLSGGTSAGPRTPLCFPHAVEWLSFSL
ncbi:MAG TPA: hypothetical protein VGJ60_07405 [Chloroflexota bacterium]|jgi:hypothetical protein